MLICTYIFVESHLSVPDTACYYIYKCQIWRTSLIKGYKVLHQYLVTRNGGQTEKKKKCIAPLIRPETIDHSSLDQESSPVQGQPCGTQSRTLSRPASQSKSDVLLSIKGMKCYPSLASLHTYCMYVPCNVTI